MDFRDALPTSLEALVSVQASPFPTYSTAATLGLVDWWTGCRAAPRKTATGGQRRRDGPISSVARAGGVGRPGTAGSSPTSLQEGEALAGEPPTPTSACSHYQVGHVDPGNVASYL